MRVASVFQQYSDKHTNYFTKTFVPYTDWCVVDEVQNRANYSCSIWYKKTNLIGVSLLAVRYNRAIENYCYPAYKCTFLLRFLLVLIYSRLMCILILKII